MQSRDPKDQPQQSSYGIISEKIGPVHIKHEELGGDGLASIVTDNCHNGGKVYTALFSANAPADDIKASIAEFRARKKKKAIERAAAVVQQPHNNKTSAVISAPKPVLVPEQSLLIPPAKTSSVEFIEKESDMSSVRPYAPGIFRDLFSSENDVEQKAVLADIEKSASKPAEEKNLSNNQLSWKSLSKNGKTVYVMSDPTPARELIMRRDSDYELVKNEDERTGNGNVSGITMIKKESSRSDDIPSRVVPPSDRRKLFLEGFARRTALQQNQNPPHVMNSRNGIR
jgi:hypothetical protein